MKQIEIEYWEAFSNILGNGNPCGVVYNGDLLSEFEMQEIAKKTAYSECAFILHPTSTTSDFRVRFFMPNRETDLCGHCMISVVMSMLEKKGFLINHNYIVETLAGQLNVSFDGKKRRVRMQQAEALFEPFNGDLTRLLYSIGIENSDINYNLPIVFGNTGVWTLLVPVNSLEAFKKMAPINSEFSSILVTHPEASVHPFFLKEVLPNIKAHCRHFSGSFSGTQEDPVTGTAAAVLSAYVLKYLYKNESEIEIEIDQGQEIGRNGLVFGKAIKDENIHTEISGTAIKGPAFTISI